MINKRLAVVVLLSAFTATACAERASKAKRQRASTKAAGAKGPATPAGLATAVFAGGCFWCMEPPFEKVKGVSAAVSGYTGGKEMDPSYKDVAYGRTGHTEAVRVTYDPKVVSYDKLLDVFWRSMDPTDADGQFVDRGKQYRPGLFYATAAEKKAALASKKALGDSGRFGKPIVVEVTKLMRFYVAEDYHQDYYKTNPGHYKRYRRGSGRDAYLHRTWGGNGKS